LEGGGQARSGNCFGHNVPDKKFDPPEAERLCDPAFEAVIEWQIALRSAV
jgi:hypothetical protein